MLVSPGDLIPVTSDATLIPWTRRKSQILNYLRRGAIDFNTLVYDTKVGDISPVSSYYNPERISVKELNTKFAKTSDSTQPLESVRIGGESVALPWILIYPDHNQDKAKAREERTLRWVMTNDALAEADTCQPPAATSSPSRRTPRFHAADSYEDSFLPAAPNDSDFICGDSSAFSGPTADEMRVDPAPKRLPVVIGNKRKSSWGSQFPGESKAYGTMEDRSFKSSNKVIHPVADFSAKPISRQPNKQIPDNLLLEPPPSKMSSHPVFDQLTPPPTPIEVPNSAKAEVAGVTRFNWQQPNNGMEFMIPSLIGTAN